MKRLPLLAAALSLFVFACGDDDKKTDTTDTAGDTSVTDTTGDTTPDTAPDTSSDDTASPDTSADTSVADTTADTGPDTTGTCIKNGFVSVAQDASFAFGTLFFIAQSTLGAPVDTLNFELLSDAGGATAPGIYTLTGENYANCGNCVLIYQGCDENLANCQKTFLAQSGSLNITTLSTEDNGKLIGTLTGATFAEVTVDENYTSTVVEGGATWCVDSFAFDVTVQ